MFWAAGEMQCFLSRPARLHLTTYILVPHACAWGYHLAPASRALRCMEAQYGWSWHNRRNLGRPTLDSFAHGDEVGEAFEFFAVGAAVGLFGGEGFGARFGRAEALLEFVDAG